MHIYNDFHIITSNQVCLLINAAVFFGKIYSKIILTILFLTLHADSHEQCLPVKYLNYGSFAQRRRNGISRQLALMTLNGQCEHCKLQALSVHEEYRVNLTQLSLQIRMKQCGTLIPQMTKKVPLFMTLSLQECYIACNNRICIRQYRIDSVVTFCILILSPHITSLFTVVSILYFL